MKINYRKVRSMHGLLHLSVFILLAVGLAFSCTMEVGLGKKVDMTGPVLTITGPDFMSNVQEKFTVSGHVSDDIDVAMVSVSMERTGATWKYQDGMWLEQLSPGAAWTSVPGATWTQSAAIAYSWSVPVSIPSNVSGEFVIKIVSKDSMGNIDASSVAQRTVVFDNAPPLSTINNPGLFVGDYSAADSDFSAYALGDIRILDKLLNGELSISGSIDDQSPKSLVLEIASQDGTVYWTHSKTNDIRNWNIQAQLPSTLTGRNILQIITRVEDTAGNKEAKSHGWFCYWPQADIPTIKTPLSLDTPSASSVFPLSEIQGQAFDDDGLSSITIILKKGVGTGAVEILPHKVIDVSASKTKSATWTFTAPQEGGEYSLLVSCKDINDVQSSIVTGLFTVEDITAPSISVATPSNASALFGDSAGTVTFSGTVDDDLGVESLKLVWINTYGTEREQSQLLYSNASYPQWASASSIDTGENKKWSIPLGSSSTNSKSRIERSFSQTINLFSDLGISATQPLSNQVFILKAEDANGKSKILTYTTVGDITEPSLSINTVTVKKSGVDTAYAITSSLLLQAFGATDTVMLSGTWSDDSTNVWTDKSKIGALSVRWGTTAFTPVLHANGTWTTSFIAPPSGAVASISASLKDFGSNERAVSNSFLVETDDPTLIRISSSNADGAYRSGGTITIDLEFNKSVTWAGGTGVPELTVNNGKQIAYVSGNGSAKHSFIYNVTSSCTSVSTLDVSSLISNGHSWKDAAGKVAIVTLPTGLNSLAGNKTIKIDTTSPTISECVSVSPAAFYASGSSIFITVNFSEPIVISSGSAMRLKLSSGVSAYANYANRIDSDSLSFAYTVAAGENALTLAVESFDVNGAVITDIAGNPLTVTLPSGSIGAVLCVDTTAPAAPTITGITAGTKYGTQSFSVTGTEVSASVEYSVNNGVSWISGSSASLSTNGIYEITARQKDQAGNVSPSATSVAVTLDIGELLTLIGSNTVDGKYTSGNTIDIFLEFRKPVWLLAGSPTLSLNTSPASSAVYLSGSGSTRLVFRYTVGASDSVSRLDVTSLNLSGVTFADSASGGSVVTSWVTMPATGSSGSLAKQKNFEIIGGGLALQSVAISADGTNKHLLTLTYNRSVFKGSGALVLAQKATGYRIPSVLSQSRYDEIYNAAADKPAIQAAYRLGTNGASVAGVSDLDGKYVLAFDTDTNDTTLVGHFRTAKAHEVRVPILSSSISISGAVVTVSLEGSFVLPVFGAEYDIEIPTGFVSDILSQASPVVATGVHTVTPSGVATPVVRIQKVSETLTVDSGSVVAVQPLTVSVKIDCQTPDAVIRYAITEAAFTTANVPAYASGKPVAGAAVTMPTTPALVSDGTSYAGSFTIGNAGNASNGYKYGLTAVAFKGAASSSPSYEVAYRSVLRINNDGAMTVSDEAGNDRDYSSLGDTATPNLVESMWVRGGDSVSGSTLTPGFPLAWDEARSTGIRLMTRETATTWYWVSWELNATAYLGIIYGTTPVTVADAKNGPWRWGWVKNAYVPFKEYYPLFPGEGRTLTSANDATTTHYNTYDGGARGTLQLATQGDGGLKSRSGDPNGVNGGIPVIGFTVVP